MRRRVGIVGAVSAALVAVAWGQSKALTPDEADAFADQLIARAKAADVFVNVTTGATPKVLHKASGLVCTFDSNPDSVLTLYPEAKRGDDVSCGSFASGAVITMYAMRPSTPTTLDQAYSGYVADILRAHSPVKVLSELNVTPNPGETLPPLKTGMFSLNMNGSPAYSRLSVAIVNGWVVEQRISRVPVDQKGLDDLGQSIMEAALREMVKAPKG